MRPPGHQAATRSTIVLFYTTGAFVSLLTHFSQLAPIRQNGRRPQGGAEWPAGRKGLRGHEYIHLSVEDSRCKPPRICLLNIIPNVGKIGLIGSSWIQLSCSSSLGSNGASIRGPAPRNFGGKSGVYFIWEALWPLRWQRFLRSHATYTRRRICRPPFASMKPIDVSCPEHHCRFRSVPRPVDPLIEVFHVLQGQPRRHLRRDTACGTSDQGVLGGCHHQTVERVRARLRKVRAGTVRRALRRTTRGSSGSPHRDPRSQLRERRTHTRPGRAGDGPHRRVDPDPAPIHRSRPRLLRRHRHTTRHKSPSTRHQSEAGRTTHPRAHQRDPGDHRNTREEDALCLNAPLFAFQGASIDHQSPVR
ncbi:hypothetical protein SAMN06295924_101424 [Rathayibacter rathayi NCPPB 2980 = VKM Ac-1601]|nr:hypothetical protein FB469_1308 [Rathayibacter rathayi]SOE02537.1 hypothetical protein SAMN06295924_101424 [Rathayibacter rathayi NCPPB 2980 = VKM Ac-1601]